MRLCKQMDAMAYGRLYTWVRFALYPVLPIVLGIYIGYLHSQRNTYHAQYIAIKPLAEQCLANDAKIKDAIAKLTDIAQELSK